MALEANEVREVDNALGCVGARDPSDRNGDSDDWVLGRRLFAALHQSRHANCGEASFLATRLLKIVRSRILRGMSVFPFSASLSAEN